MIDRVCVYLHVCVCVHVCVSWVASVLSVSRNCFVRVRVVQATFLVERSLMHAAYGLVKHHMRSQKDIVTGSVLAAAAAGHTCAVMHVAGHSCWRL